MDMIEELQKIVWHTKDIVLIKWVDSKGITNWEDIDELEPMLPVECCSVGFLLENKKAYKTIAIGLGGKQVLGRLTIPSSCIRSLEKLVTSKGAENG